MKTYKFYLKASSYLLNFSQDTGGNRLSSDEKEYYYISSILLSWIALEAFINSISESFSQSSRLKPHEKYFLNEKELKVNDDGTFEDRLIRPPTTKKILFLIRYFTKLDIKKFKKEKIWGNIKSFEDLRNKIIHSKNKNNFEVTSIKANEFLDLINDFIGFLSKKFKNT